jgi:hypothetical protein
VAASQRLVSPAEVFPGDILLTRTGKWWSLLIRLGASLKDRPNVWNHAIVAHHRDKAGTFWGLEGRAGGVGWVDLTPVLRDEYTIGNLMQPKTGEQRQKICDAALAAIGTGYDWPAIARVAADAIQPLWKLKGGTWGKGRTVPGALICSALADWAYEMAGLSSPRADRWCTPADWADFILTEGWR